MITLFAFGVSVLAAIGLDAFTRSADRRRVAKFLMSTCAVLGASLVALVVIERSPQDPFEGAVRYQAIEWSLGGLALLLVVALVTFRSGR